MIHVSLITVQLIRKTSTSYLKNCMKNYLYNKGTLYSITCQKMTKFISWYFFFINYKKKQVICASLIYVQLISKRTTSYLEASFYHNVREAQWQCFHTPQRKIIKKIKISLKTINIFICILFFVFNFIKSKRKSINQYDFYLVYKQSDVFVICTENGTNRMQPAGTD